MQPQTDRAHYDDDYYDRRRLYSVAVQAEMLRGLEPASVLEVGPGVGAFAALFRQLSGAVVITVDIDPTLKPNLLGSVLELPFAEGTFDAVACFQMLEHLPFDRFVPALREMRRVARRGMVLSLPDCSYALTLRLGVGNPRKDGGVGVVSLQPAGWALRTFNRVPNSAGHYWEIGRRGTPLTAVRGAIVGSGWKIDRELRSAENAYHRFFVLK
jgi:SAM-dependent methyltransferase